MLSRGVPLLLLGLLAALFAPVPAGGAAAPGARPDLVVAKLATPPADVLRGQSFRVRHQVRNVGRQGAGKSVVRYYLSRDAKRGKGDLALGTRATRALGAGKKATVRVLVTVPAAAPYASYLLLACADAKRRVKESKEKNNCRASKSRVRVRPRPVQPPPPVDPPGLDPTPVDPTVPTDFERSVEFLYSGDDAVQQGVAPDAIDTDRVVVLRGRAVDVSGAPAPGVRVTVLDHPELGHTLTREDGRYDLAVNGGAAVTLDFAKDGLLTVQRTIAEVPWLDFVVVDDLVVTALDTESTVVAPDEANEPVVAAAAPVTDADGTRQAVLLFEPGTQAEMTLPDGSTRSLDEMTVRATEYTVGEDGPAQMPAALPASSAYTYAAEFSLDEAVAAGATNVEFSKPVVNYLENYLGMPVGVAVPSGYYDREAGHWVAGRNGRVIAVVGETGGLADVDVDGDGAADTGAALTGLGLDEAERATLAERYDAGQELWRVLIDHFTPWDHNWPYGPPDDAAYPDQPEPGNRRAPGDTERPCVKPGSLIGCQSQTLGETLPVTGTDYSLDYSSSRAAGRTSAYVLTDIPVTGASVPASLSRVDLTVTVAGRKTTKTFAATANQTYDFEWDGLDAYGRRVLGEHRVDVRVDYHYAMQYYARETDFERAFGRLRSEYGGRSTTLVNRSSATMALSAEWSGWLGGWQAPTRDLGGWSLAPHHVYDSASGTLHLGSGTSRRADTLDVLTKPWSRTLDNINYARAADFDAEGRMYLSGPRCDCVVRLDGPDKLTPIAGTDSAGFSGDGGPATAARLDQPFGIAVAPDGTVYVSDFRNHRIRRIAPGGTISTYAGTGTPGFSGDGGPAVDADLHYPRGLALGPDGSLYVADSGNRRIRRIATDGVITTLVGGGDTQPTEDGVPADQARLLNADSVAVGPDGSVYYSEENDWQQGLVRRVTPDGDAEAVAGGGYGSDGDQATAAHLVGAQGIDVAPDGTLYIAEQNGYRVRSVEPDGVLRTVAGNGQCCEPALGSAARSVPVLPWGVTLAPDGRLHVLAQAGPFVVGPASPRLQDDEVSVPSSDGSQLYQFDRSGRHLRTVNSMTLAVIQEFGYDASGRLTRVTDADGRVTTVERDATGAPTAIVAPGGQRTRLTLDAAGHLASVTNPAGEKVTLSTSADGLLESFTDSMGHTSTFGYDGSGRLVSDRHSVLGEQTLTRTEIEHGYRVVHTSAEGRRTVYETVRDVVGRVITTTTDPVGGTTVVTDRGDGSTQASFPDGSVTTTWMTGDPRFGIAAPYENKVVTRLPSGRTMTVTRSKWVELADQADLLSVRTSHDRLSVNDREETYEYDVSTGRVTYTSAAGVRSVSQVDAQGRVRELVAAVGGAPTTYTYDDLGRVRSVRQADQGESYTYDARGRVATMTDGLGHVTTYAWDDADRLVATTLPGQPARTYRYGYDANGNRTSITMPNGQVHTQSYSPRDQLTGYRPGTGLPGSVSTRDDDGKVLERTLPDGSEVRHEYADTGRFVGTSYTEADLHFTYVAGSEVVDVLTRTPAEGAASATAQVLDLDHDATLLTKAATSGATTGTHTYTYDDRFFLTGIDLVSGDDRRSLTVTRDDDGMITRAGEFAWARTAIGRRVGSVRDGTLDAEYSYDATRRFTGRSDAVAGHSAYDLALTFDDAGRIATKTEEVAGTGPVTWSYEYDETGQLESVERDGQPVADYGYDVNGNRTTPAATYDGQDRLLTRGDTAYSFDDNGFLTGRGDDELVYSETGELLSASVDGQDVTYAYDATGRMVARTDDAGTREYLYGNPGQPFQVTATRAPDGVLTSLEYDEEGRVYALRRSGELYYVSSDHLGSPRVVTDRSGTVVATREYDAFGVPVEAGTTHPDFDVPVGFAGGIEDPLTGLVRFGFRDYEPESGRWTTRDPALFAGGQANLYVYVGNNPVVLRDPAGLFCIGGSLYGGIGGGVQVCHRDGESSLCAEVGFGLGADAGLESGGAAETGEEVGVEGKAVCGPVGIGFNCSLNNCGEAKCKGKGEVGPFTADTEGTVGLQPSLEGPEVLLNVNARPKCSLQGKVYGKVCQKF